jgi:hypothetical protein
MYDENGNRRTENGKPVNPDGTPQGDTEVVEEDEDIIGAG